MIWRVEYHPEAIADGREAYAWYKQRNPEVARAFASSVKLAIGRVRANPMIAHQHRRGTRRIRVQRFPYYLVFLPLEGGLKVLAIAHTSRSPRFWFERLSEQP